MELDSEQHLAWKKLFKKSPGKSLKRTSSLKDSQSLNFYKYYVNKQLDSRSFLSY